MRKLKPVLKAHEGRMVARLGEDGRDALIGLLREIANGGPRNGARLKSVKASRSLRPGSVAT